MYQVARAGTQTPLCAHEFPGRRFLKLYHRIKSPADHDCPMCAIALTNPARAIAQCIIGATVMRIGPEVKKRKAEQVFAKLLDILPYDAIIHIIEHIDNPVDIAKVLHLDTSMLNEYNLRPDFYKRIIFQKGVTYAFPHARDKDSFYDRAASIVKMHNYDVDSSWSSIKNIISEYDLDYNRVSMFVRMMRYLNIGKDSPLYGMVLNEFENIARIYNSLSAEEEFGLFQMGDYDITVHLIALYATIKDPDLVKVDESITEFTGIQVIQIEMDIGEVALLSNNHDLAMILLDHRNAEGELIFSARGHYEAAIELFELYPNKYKDVLLKLSDALAETPEKGGRDLDKLYFFISRAYIVMGDAWLLDYIKNISPYMNGDNFTCRNSWPATLVKTITSDISEYIKKVSHVKISLRENRTMEIIGVLVSIYKSLLLMFQ